MKLKNHELTELPMLSELIPALAAMEKEHVQFFRAAMPRNGVPADALSHMVIACLRRSLDNIRGFLAMADQRNIFCGMPIMRFQIDTAMFLFARTIVSDVTDLMRHVAEGKRLSDYEYQPKKKLSDSYLHQELTKKHPVTSDLYKEASGYVHFSKQHLHRVLDLERFKETQEVVFKDVDQPTAGWNDQELRGAMVCFLWATDAILAECKEWMESKQLV
jgi:hypothetical protein